MHIIEPCDNFLQIITIYFLCSNNPNMELLEIPFYRLIIQQTIIENNDTINQAD